MAKIQVGKTKIGIIDIYTIVDDIDYWECKQYTWGLHSKGYAATSLSKPRQMLLIHQLIIERMGLIVPEKYDIDHKDQNRLNNQRENLRVVTRSQNNLNKGPQCDNSTGITGIYWKTDHNKYQARIGVNGKLIHLGYFENLEDAVAARLAAEEKYYPGVKIKV